MVYKAGILFEGGGMRGAYTSGVIDALLENNILCEKCYGVSSGACHATNYISRQIGRSLRVTTDFAGDERYCSAKSLFKTGNFFGIEMIYETIPRELDKFDFDTARTSPTKFYACATNVKTGKMDYLLVGDMYERSEYMKIAASMALPFLAKICKIDGQKYLDGGVADSLPVKRTLEEGNDKLVLVLTQAKPFEKKFNWLTPLVALRYLIYPKYTASFATRHVRYNESLKYIDEMEKEGKVFVIRPQNPVELKRLEVDREKIRDLYEVGYREANELMPALRTYLEG